MRDATVLLVATNESMVRDPPLTTSAPWPSCPPTTKLPLPSAFLTTTLPLSRRRTLFDPIVPPPITRLLANTLPPVTCNRLLSPYPTMRLDWLLQTEPMPTTIAVLLLLK